VFAECLSVIVQSLTNGSVDKSPLALNSLKLDGIDSADSLAHLTTELSSAHAQIAELSTKINDVEETLSSTQKELTRSQELNTKLQRDVREVWTIDSFCAIAVMLAFILSQHQRRASDSQLRLWQCLAL